jgi:hypothetical protein
MAKGRPVLAQAKGRGPGEAGTAGARRWPGRAGRGQGRAGWRWPGAEDAVEWQPVLGRPVRGAG